ncbi:4-hydroxybenzoyl-CoA thioesterase [Rhodococcus sp. D2-41]|uniref:Thioesterase n=1 Tax=Speluncibacter jeojiensis TaxID=2710754 RepID=A0A9X4REU4_9ACTN|nr:acyl-ACP thioesterase domain-containing protein [Rhodococcus sp. D2-41]MDG3009153.1 4-hydroxybenzoyl-CoA thioesterase [Rhodococcus sp. D2-41]MDG3016174.1 thioesterase [Corynebacteriales bacterium D3-21]
MDTTRTLPPWPAGAPLFETSRPVRTGDVDADRRLRLDGVARYLQDIGWDNLDAIGLREVHPLWIVRRTVIDVLVPGTFPDRVRLHRWCSELSNRWCHMRVDVDSDGGTDIRTEGFWINISPDTGMPTRMADEFIEPLLEHTTEHRLRWHRRLTAAKPEAEAPGVQVTPFPLRFTDVDLLGHVNNAVYWHAVEEHLSDRPDLMAAPHRATIEYLSPVLGTDSLRLWVAHGDAAVDLWFEVDGELRAQARVEAH